MQSAAMEHIRRPSNDAFASCPSRRLTSRLLVPQGYRILGRGLARTGDTLAAGVDAV